MSEPAPPVASAGGGGAEDGTAGNPRGRTRRAKNRRYRQNVQTRSRLQIACWNAEGLRRKLTELQGWLSASHIDVLAIQEAQFQASGPTEVPGFQTAAVFRRARGRRDGGPAKGGDVAIYVRKGLNFSRLETCPSGLGGHHYRVVRHPPVPERSRSPHEERPCVHPGWTSTTSTDRPIRPGEDDQRTDHFDPAALPSPHGPRIPAGRGLERPPPGVGPTLCGGG